MAKQLSPSGKHLAREYARARAQGVTQKQFAASVGMSPRYVRKILSGERSGKVLERRARGGVLSVPVEYEGKTEAYVQVRLPVETSRWDIYQPKVRRAMKRSLKAAEEEEKVRARPLSKPQNVYDTARLKGKKDWARIRPAKRAGYHVASVTLWRVRG